MRVTASMDSVRYYGLDWLRGLAAIGIVGCHLNLNPKTVGGEWLLHFTDMNVGVFGIISGFLLARAIDCGTFDLNKPLGFRALLRHRIQRILPVYLFWSVVYVGVSAVFTILTGAKLSEKIGSVDHWISVVFNGGASCHLWFLSGLIYSTILLVPLLMAIRSGRVRIWSFSILSVIFLLLTVCNLSVNFCFYTLRLWAFVSAGVVLWQTRDLLLKISRCGWLVALMLLGALSCIADLWPHHFIPDYLCAGVLVPVFLDLKWKQYRIGSVLGKTSLAVYLVHPLFAATLGLLVKRYVSSPFPWWIVLMDWLVVYVLALISAVALVRIPGLNRLAM